MEDGFLQYVRPGVVAIRRFWKPFLLIQFCGFLIIVLYFKTMWMKQRADSLGEFAHQHSIPFSMIMCAIASAVIPELAKMVTMGDVKWDRKRLNDLVFNLGLFSIMGLISIGFYTFLQWLWPTDEEMTTSMRIITSMKKMALDQFIYSPFITLVVVSVGYTIRDANWNLIRFFKMLGVDWYLSRVGKLIIPCWCFWIPMTTLMYSLSSPHLVLIFSMLAQAAWALVMLFVASGKASKNQG